MGCYTQFHAKIPLRKDTPDDVVLLIMHAVYDPDFYSACIDPRNDLDGPHPLILPEHEFFQQERWGNIFMRSNYYHETGARFTRSRSGYYDLEINCDINYGHVEVQCFLDWIKPWIAGRRKKQFLGYWRNDNMMGQDSVNEYIER